MSESQIQESLARYLRLNYPNVIFHSDFGSGVKLTPAQAVRQNRQNGGYRAWPDLFIAEPRTKQLDFDGIGAEITVYCGLFIELKKEGVRLKKKNGDWATPHIAEQAGMLEKLKERGFGASFAVGYEDAVRVIDTYLKGAENAL